MPIGGRERWGDFDFLFGAARLKLRILELPVHYTERRSGKSKMRVMVDGWRFLWACIFRMANVAFPAKSIHGGKVSPPKQSLMSFESMLKFNRFDKRCPSIYKRTKSS